MLFWSTKGTVVNFWKWPFYAFTQATLIWLHNNFYVLILKLTDFNKAWWNSCNTQNGHFEKLTTVLFAHQNKMKNINCLFMFKLCNIYSILQLMTHRYSWILHCFKFLSSNLACVTAAYSSVTYLIISQFSHFSSNTHIISLKS